MKRLNLLLAALCIVLTGEVHSQNWVIYDTTNSNIPGNTVKCLNIDNQGNKWIGTEKGLAKFDGNTWTTYDTLNSNIPYNNISALAIDREGNKWIGTYQYEHDSTYNLKTALAKFDGNNWTIYDTSNSKIRNQPIREIAIDSSGNKWFGYVYGLLKLEDTSWTAYTNWPLPSSGVLEIAIDKDGKKWISVGDYGWFSTRDGALAVYDDTTWTVYNYHDPQLGAWFVNSIAFDDAGNKWMGGYGFAQFDGTSWTRYDTINYDDIVTVAIDDFNNKWIGFLTNYSSPAMAKFDGVNWRFFNKSNSGIPSNSVYQITVDKYDNKWLATSGGLVVYNENGVSVEENKQTENRFTVYPNPTTGSFQVKGITSDPDGIKVEMYDMSGKTVFARKYRKDSPAINIENLTPGVYFVKLTVKDQTAVRKVIKR